MRIKLAILESDQSYLNRIVTAFNTKYSDKFEIYSFTNENIALSTLDSARIDVLVASDSFEINMQKLPKRCGFAYFTDSADIETINDQRAICKFQKADLIYKQILSIYSENVSNVSGVRFDEDTCKVVVFEPVSGGCGASTMAAACSVYLASKGKRVLYLNLEKFGTSDLFFSAEGQFGMSDIVFALKSKKTNLAIKLESCVKQDESGVFFYASSKVALDMMELTNDDISHLISELCIMGSYDYIVIDADFSVEKNVLKIYRRAKSIIWISDGSEISNSKLYKAFNAMNILEQDEDSSLTNRLLLIYNKFSNKTSKALSEIGIKNIGGAPRYEHATTMQVVEQLSKMEMFEKIM